MQHILHILNFLVNLRAHLTCNFAYIVINLNSYVYCYLSPYAFFCSGIVHGVAINIALVLASIPCLLLFLYFVMVFQFWIRSSFWFYWIFFFYFYIFLSWFVGIELVLILCLSMPMLFMVALFSILNFQCLKFCG